MYSSAISGENYLRGVQAADADGMVTFTTIFPGCYDGRMPHVHFEVYPTLAKAGSASNRIKTSQFGFPVATCNEVYTATGYSASVRNFARISFATVFRETATPASCRSAWIRGAPYGASDAAWNPRICSVSSASEASRADVLWSRCW